MTGTCQVCHDEVSLRADGTTALHEVLVSGDRSRPGGNWGVCPGSYVVVDRPHVHRCSCGVTFGGET